MDCRSLLRAPSHAHTCSEVESRVSIEDVCEACGTLLTAPRPVDTRPAPPQKAPAPPVAKQSPRKPKRRPRRTPTTLRLKETRASVKIDMLTAIPGLSRAKAAAILEACEGSFVRLVGMSSTQIGRAPCRGSPIGTELGVAVFRALH